MAQSSRIKVNWDKKGKPRATITKEAASLLTNWAVSNRQLPIFLVLREAAAPSGPYLKLEGPAITKRPEEDTWIRTTIYVRKSIKVAFSIAMAVQGLTTCQAHRNFMEQIVGLAEQSEARKSYTQ